MPIGRPPVPPHVRFWKYVRVQGPDDCWEWTGARNIRGYGNFTVVAYPKDRREQIGSHRFSYRLVHGEIPHDKFVLHKCDNPPCVNPEHLYLGSHNENMADRHAKGRYANGTRHPNSALTDSDVVLILELRRQGLLIRQIASRIGTSIHPIRKVLDGNYATVTPVGIWSARG